MSGTNIVYDATTNTYYTTLSDAITGSSSNDVLLVAGDFVENFPKITHSLTIEAIGGTLVSLTNPQPLPPNGRAILDCPFDAGVNLTISGLDISGANDDVSGSDNGAGILFEVGNGLLTVNNSWIHDNEDGILTGGPDAASPGGVMSVFIDHSEINDNGVPDTDPRYGFDHNIYAGDLTQLSVTNSYIHDALGGHEIKTRALTSIIENNVIADGPDATTSYSIDLPDGGSGIVSGNVIEKGPSSPNKNIVHFGGEGTYPGSNLLVAGNTFINDRAEGATVVLNQTQEPNIGSNDAAIIANNTIYDGNGAAALNEDDFPPAIDVASNNTFLTSPDPAIDTSAPFDLTLVSVFAWTGAANDTNLSNAANWTDVTGSAVTAPGPEDTAEFATGGGTLSASITVTAAAFTGDNIWTLGSTAAIDANGGGVTVGSGAPTTLVIGPGGQIETTGTGDAIGVNADDFGTVDIAGAGAAWTAQTGLTVGAFGTGAMNIQSAGALIDDGAATLGANAGASGSLLLSGIGSHASITGQSNIGQGGIGDLRIENQATVARANLTGQATQGIDLATLPGSQGNVLVTGTNSLLANTGSFVVGDQGLGQLSIQSGGHVVTSPGTIDGLNGLLVANNAGASGSSVNVSGTGSRLDVGGLLDVGAAGSGALQISGGATVTAGSLDAGNVAAAVGQIGLTGAGTELFVTNAATVADDGTGVLSVLNGATFAAASLTIGNTGNSSGALIVSGTGSEVNLSGALNIGTALGIGDLTVGPGAAVHASVVSLQGQVVLEGGLLDPTVQLINQGQTAGGFGTIAAGDIVDEGVIQAGGNKASQRLLLVEGTILGGGTLTVNGTLPGSNPTGVLQINAGGTMELTGPVINAAATTFTDNLTPTGTYSVNNSGVDVTFADAKGVLKLDDIAGFGGTVTTFQAGDSFVISGGTLSNLDVSNANTLTMSDSGTGRIDRIIFGSGVSASGFAIVNNNTIQVACFAAGTRMETANGPVAVEALRVGDLVLTEDVHDEANPPEQIVWIGQRSIDCERHPKPETVWPVRVQSGAFGENVPLRDLYLSPDHAVFIYNVLIPVKLLINGASITQVERARITYFHVELPRHAVILAEGLPVESYLDTGDRANFHGGSQTIRLFPDFTANAAEVWETRGAAKLIVAGRELVAARTVLDANAARRASEANSRSTRRGRSK